MENGLTIGKPTPVMIRREMLKRPEVMKALEPIERAVFIASTAKTIEEYSSGELLAELATALKWIAKDIGYRVTDEADRQYMVVRTAEILKRYYRNFTLKDFHMAFEMAITGALDEFLPRGRDGQADRGHYQQFNAEYVCKILNAYKARRGGIMKKANESMPRRREAVPVDEKAAASRRIRADLFDAFLQYKYRGKMPRVSSIAEMLFYDILAGVGLADPVEVSLADQRDVLQRAALEFVRKDMMYDAARLKKEGPSAKELEHGSFSRARRRALLAAFDMIIENEIQLDNYIKFE